MAYIRQIQKENIVNTNNVENVKDFLEKLNSKGKLYELIDAELPIESNEINIIFEEENLIENISS